MNIQKSAKFLAATLMPAAAIGLLLVGAGIANAQTMPTPGVNGGAWHGRGEVGGGMMGLAGHGTLGTVTAISGTTLTITSKFGPKGETGTTYSVDASNATVTKGGAASSVSAIAIGDTVTVTGTASGTSITATKINDGAADGRMMGGKGSGIVGTVATVNGNSLTVTSKFEPKDATSTTYTVDATNAKVTKNGATSTLSAIAVGDTVMIAGTVSGTSVTATTIRDGMPQGGPEGKIPAQSPIQGNGEPIVGGTVVTISGNTLTVTNKGNVTYTVDATNAKIVKRNATSSIANVSVGDNIIVQGVVNGNAITASSVIDQGAAPSENAAEKVSMGRGGFAGGIVGAIGGFFGHLFGF